MENNTKILIDNQTAIRLKYFTHFAPGEVSGLGKSIITDDGDILIIDILLYKQECTGSTTSLDVVDISRVQEKLVEDGEDMRLWNVWWHTHADFGVFWSSPDDACIAEQAGFSDHLVSIVTNKKQEFKGRLDIFPKDTSPFKKRFGGTQFDCDVEVVLDGNKRSAVDEKVLLLLQTKETIKNELKLIDDEIENEEHSLMSDSDVRARCEQEISDKVSEKEYSTKVTKGFEYNDFERQQSSFDRMLDNIMFAIPSNSYQDIDEVQRKTEEYLDGFCEECGKELMFCECPDAEQKMLKEAERQSTIESVNGYLKNNPTYWEDRYDDLEYSHM